MGLLVDLAIAFLALAIFTALVVAAAHFLTDPIVRRLAPKWRARIRLSALFAPLCVGTLGVFVALLPSLLHAAGIASDHCSHSLKHGHTHLCFLHGTSAASGPWSVIVASALAFILVRIALVVTHAWRASRLFSSIVSTSRVTRLGDGAYHFDSDLPFCVTAGVIRPRVYISSAAAHALGSDCVTAALAHERGHVARHETRMRLLGAIAAVFHLPPCARSILHLWHTDSEFLCDQFASRRTGSATLVAEALVRFQRAMLEVGADTPHAAACLCTQGSALSARVVSLLSTNTEEGSIRDEIPTLMIGVFVLLAGLGLQVPRVHHALESLVGLLASAAS